MAKYGVILANIGTPQSPETPDVRKYLKQFLMDKYVIDIPWPVRAGLVYGIIAPLRSKRSSKAYKKIWTDRGSPLLFHTQDYAKKLSQSLGEDFEVLVGMRYGQPSIDRAVEKLKACEKIVIFPQYPQYAESSSRSSLEAFARATSKGLLKEKTKSVPAFYSNATWLSSVEKNIGQVLDNHPIDHVLFSYHGLPERHLTKIDPQKNHCANYQKCCENPGESLKTCYRAQAHHTTQALARRLGLSKDKFSMSFQSRLGKQVWIPPYTDKVLPELAQKGVKNLAVVCPSFVADCLETLEEIAMEGRETFQEAGGGEFHYIPCSNSDDLWVQAGTELIQQALATH